MENNLLKARMVMTPPVHKSAKLDNEISHKEHASRRESMFRHVFESVPDPLLLLDTSVPPRIRASNRASDELIGYRGSDLLGKSLCDFLDDPNAALEFQEKLGVSAMDGGDLEVLDVDLVSSEGDRISVDIRVIPVANDAGDQIGWLYSLRSQTRRLRTHELLLNERHKLEHLRKAVESKNEALERVIHEMETEKERVSTQIISNISKTVMPLVSLLRERQLPDDRVYVDLLETNLRDIASTFTKKLETKYPRLSPREAEICRMIRAGFATKEIAHILNVSEQTIGTQRNRIRRKLGLINSDINLSSYLKSLDIAD